MSRTPRHRTEREHDPGTPEGDPGDHSGGDPPRRRVRTGRTLALVATLGVVGGSAALLTPANAVLAWYSDPCEDRDTGGQITFAAHPTSTTAGTGVGISACENGSLELHDPDRHEPGLADLVPADNGRTEGAEGYVDLVITLDGKGLYALRGTGEVVATGTASDDIAGPAPSWVTGRAVALSLDPDGTSLLTVTETGDVSVRGRPDQWGDPPQRRPGASIVDVEWSQTGGGYWVLAADGSTMSTGDAVPGDGAVTTEKDPAVGIVQAPEKDGYWIVTRGGKVTVNQTRYLEDLGECRRLGRGGISGVTRAPADSAGIDLWVTTREGGICAFERRWNEDTVKQG